MKPKSPKVLLLLVVIVFSNLPEIAAERKIIQPKECRTSNYTCVLKKNDGVPFFCVKTARQRQQNARQKVRIVSEQNCVRRYPVEYEVENPAQPKDKN